MRSERWGYAQRDPGQLEAGSWAADTLARLGEAIPAVLAAASIVMLGTMSLTAPAGANAATHGHAPAPSPQPAPVGTSSAPTPDPVPQAAAPPPPTHTSSPTYTSAPPAPVVHQPTSGSSTGADGTHVSTSTGTSSAGVAPSTRTDTGVVRTTAAPVVAARVRGHSSPSLRHGRAAAPHRARPHHVATVHRVPPRVAPSPITLSPITLSMPKALLDLPRAVFRASVQEHRDGRLLLVASAAMALLAVASFSLLRRLRRLVPR